MSKIKDAIDTTYIPDKGVYVGSFDLADIDNQRDNLAVEQVKKLTGYNYTNTELVRKKGKIVALKIWVCDADDFKVAHEYGGVA